MRKKQKDKSFNDLPPCVAEYINLVIKLMRYRRKVRDEVKTELAAHFEDALKDCKDDDEKEKKAQKLITEFGDAKMLAVLTRRAKRRCRPLWQTIAVRSFQALGLLIACFIFYCFYISLGTPTIAVNYIEQMTHLARPVADEALNAVPLYTKAFELYVKLPPLQEERGNQIYLLDEIIVNFSLSDLSDEYLSALRRWIQDNSETLQSFTEATQKPYCCWNRSGFERFGEINEYENMGFLRNLASLMCWRAIFKANDKYHKEALDDLLTCYQAGMHLKGPRLIREQNTGLYIQQYFANSAITILSNDPADRQELKNFQDALEKLMTDDTFLINYDVERFKSLDFIQRCYTDNGKGSGHLIPGRVREFFAEYDRSSSGRVIPGDVEEFLVDNYGKESENLIPFLWEFQYIILNKKSPANKVLDRGFLLGISIAGADRREMCRAFQRCFNDLQKEVNKTPFHRRKESRTGGYDISMLNNLTDASYYTRARYWPVWYFKDILEYVGETPHLTQCKIEALISVLGLLRYKQEKGSYPDSLNQLLANEYIKELPMDPYSDKPLVYKRTDEKFTLYSVGLNCVDDGGRMDKDEQENPRTWADNDDVVFWPKQLMRIRRRRIR